MEKGIWLWMIYTHSQRACEKSSSALKMCKSFRLEEGKMNDASMYGDE